MFDEMLKQISQKTGRNVTIENLIDFSACDYLALEALCKLWEENPAIARKLHELVLDAIVAKLKSVEVK